MTLKHVHPCCMLSHCPLILKPVKSQASNLLMYAHNRTLTLITFPTPLHKGGSRKGEVSRYIQNRFIKKITFTQVYSMMEEDVHRGRVF